MFASNLDSIKGLQILQNPKMEHQRCFIYEPPTTEERTPKRQRTNQHSHQAYLLQRLETYRKLWAQQEEHIQKTLDEADGAVQEKIINLISTSHESRNELAFAIPTALIVAGPSIASHGPFFERLGRRVRKDVNSSYVLLNSGECPNLKTLIKNLIKKATSRFEDEDDEYEPERQTTSSKSGPKLLNYDLGHVQEWQKTHRVSSIVVAIQDSEALNAGLLGDMIDLFHSWLDRLPFVLLFGIATSAENFEDHLSGNSQRYLQGEKFDVTQSDDIIEKLFAATVASTDIKLRIGPNLCHRMLDRQKDHVQNVQDFSDGLKYAYMSHFYASLPSVLLDEQVKFQDLTSDVFEALRNLPSFRRYVDELLEASQTDIVRDLLESDESLFNTCTLRARYAHQGLSRLSYAVQVLHRTRQLLIISPNMRLSSIWARAASGDIVGSPLLRETMLSIKKIPSDRLLQLLACLETLQGEFFTVDILPFRQQLEELLEQNDASTPLRTQHDVRNDSLRTTVVAQKILLSKHKAALSEQDKAYSELVTRFHDELDRYFESVFIDPRALFMSDVLIYDLKSPHLEVFQPKPRFAIERALASPHDYLGCTCCLGADGNPAALCATQPATTILYQLYLESGALINVTDLWYAFNTVVGDGEDENEPKIMALFQRALAELKYLGLVKPSRKKTDHMSKVLWKGL